MTRKEELEKKVKEVFQCEAFGDNVGKSDVLELLIEVEREVLERVQRRYHHQKLMSDFKTFDEWLTARQQELT